MKHYLAVLVPTAAGGWHAYLPDFPGCDAEGPTVEVVIAASSGAASEMPDGFNSKACRCLSPNL